MTDVTLSIYRDGWTGGLQLAVEDETGGYRILGPKFNGSGGRVASRMLDERDIKQLRHYLDRAARGTDESSVEGESLDD